MGVSLSPAPLQSAGARERYGILGGAFDPPHEAHLALARAAVRYLRLEGLVVVPTGAPSHRPATLSPAVHRLAMTRLAFAAVERAWVDDRELRRDGPSFTIDTVRELQAERPGADWFLIIGEDQARVFDRWKSADELVKRLTVAVAQRPLLGRTPSVDRPVATRVSDGLRLGEARGLSLPTDLMPISATQIRAACAKGQSVAGLVPSSVARYIEQNSLYQKS